MSRGVKLIRMGQHLVKARYPIHWHLIGEGQGQYLRNSAVHDTFNRCVTVHGTNNLRVENNVTFDTVGHCFFLETASRPAPHRPRRARNRWPTFAPSRGSAPAIPGRPSSEPIPPDT